MASEERFGYEWDTYREIKPVHEEQFRAWVAPLGPPDFTGKSVLDAGCGAGRNSYWALNWGVRSLLAFDHDTRSVAATKGNLKQFPNAQVAFHDIHQPGLKEQFDIVMSIGVVHHLERPVEALRALFALVRPGGTFVVWVYSFEGYEWIVRFVDPLRKHITARLPVSFVHLSSYIFTLPLYLYLKLIRPRRGYLGQLTLFNFHHIAGIVFDQLIPAVAHYWTKEEVAKLFKSAGISDFNIHRPPHDCGWTVIAKK